MNKQKADVDEGGKNTGQPSISAGYHIPVLLHETIENLQVTADGVYVDCTFGGGGHSKALLKKLGKNGRLIVFDQDADAKRNLQDDKRLLFIPQNFKFLQRFLRLHEVNQVDGIMADLGVSSHQFDEAERGFSFRFDAALDMRMDQRQENTAADVLKNFTEHQLHKMLEQYGEVTNAKTLAKRLVEQRSLKPISTIKELKQAVESVVKGSPQKYFAQLFQALRIEVNDELGALRELLQQTASLLKPGGRIAIITFHSLEDRMVKNFFKTGSFEEENMHDLYGNKSENPFLVITKKPIIAGAKEQKENSRSRSAKLRVAEKKLNK